MTLQAELRAMAEELISKYAYTIQAGDIESALHAAVKRVLEQIVYEIENWPHDDYWPPEIANKLRAMNLLKD